MAIHVVCKVTVFIANVLSDSLSDTALGMFTQSRTASEMKTA